MNTASFEEMLQECLHNCTECHQICLQVSVSTEVVGKLGAGDVKLLLNCAELCATCADFLATRSRVSSLSLPRVQ